MPTEIKFEFTIDQSVKVLCLGIVTKGAIVQRIFKENNSGIYISYLVKIDSIGDTVSPSESLLIDTQKFPLGHVIKVK
jgi:hypothetical protein